MTDVENDVWETIKLSGHYKHNSFDKYGPVYPYSNENLDKLFSCIQLPLYKSFNKNTMPVGNVFIKK